MSLKTLETRLQYAGGDQLGRINKQKLKSFLAALKNDYQSRTLETEQKELWQCLINADKTKPDYDDKVLSAHFDSKLSAGDVFRLIDDDTHWMVYLPELTETAYLRASIRRCRYNIEVNGNTYWVYFQGPVETKINWNLKGNITWNDLNYTGTLYIKSTPDTLEFFQRFTKIKIDGKTWEAQAVDRISVAGIIEVELKEYYENSQEELPEVNKEPENAEIIGKTIVKPDSVIGYEIDIEALKPEYEWSITGNDNVIIGSISKPGNIISAKVDKTATGSYDVNYGKYTLHAVIETILPEISGEIEIYPYDYVEYTFLGEDSGSWSVNSSKVRITEQNSKMCGIEVLTGKSGEFDLIYTKSDGSQSALHIVIKSL